MWMKIAAWALNNWRPVLAGLALIVVAGYSYRAGYERSDQEWTLAALREREEAQASADRHAKEYETERGQAEAALRYIRRSLADERKTNAAFDTCRAGPRLVQLYRDASEGRPASQPGGGVSGPGRVDGR